MPNVSLAKGALFFSPWGLGLVAFIAYPIAASLVYAFCDYSVLSTPRFVGPENFRDLLDDPYLFGRVAAIPQPGRRQAAELPGDPQLRVQ